MNMQRIIIRCDLLEILYLRGTINNTRNLLPFQLRVVICLKFCTFAVQSTTNLHCSRFIDRCDLLEILYLRGTINNIVGV